MECKLTHVSPPYPSDGGYNIQMVNVTRGYCATTPNTRYEAMGVTNLLTLAHYPMTAILYEIE